MGEASEHRVRWAGLLGPSPQRRVPRADRHFDDEGSRRDGDRACVPGLLARRRTARRDSPGKSRILQTVTFFL